jgi:hypothetical protein
MRGKTILATAEIPRFELDLRVKSRENSFKHELAPLDSASGVRNVRMRGV